MTRAMQVQAYSAKEIGCVLEMSRQAVEKRAKRESWPSRPRTGRGGGREYPLTTLPEPVQVRVRAYAEQKALLLSPDSRLPAKKGRASLAEIPEKKRDKALAKVDIVALYQEAVDKAGHGSKAKVKADFVAAYKGGAHPELYSALGPNVSWQSIERWAHQLREAESVTGLVDQRGNHNHEKRLISEDHAAILLRIALQPNRKTRSAVARDAAKIMRRQGMVVPHERTMRRYLSEWKSENYGTWVYTRQGKKAWNDLAAFYIDRDYDLISVGDIMVADGHVLNFETLNPWTGKGQRMELVVWYDMASNCPCGWEILPTENTLAIANAFRRACIALGKYPKIAYLDNGKAFRSRYFNDIDLSRTRLGGLFGELGIETIFAWPYHGQSKTVERFFGTLHELEQWVPSYTGNHVYNKPPRLNRGEKMHRKVYEATFSRPLTMEESHVAVAWWIDQYIQRPQRGHLNGKCPAEVFLASRGPGVDQAELRHLMMAKEIRSITRHGIKLFGRRYYAPELYGRTHEALVRYDPQDQSCVHVYKTDGTFICTAAQVKGIHPAANHLGNAEHRADFQAAIELKRSQEKDAAQVVRGVLEDAMADQQHRMEQLQVEQAKEAAPPEPKPLSQAEIKSIEAAREKAMKAREEATYIPPEEVRTIITEQKKYDYLFKAHYKDGFELRPEDAEWMSIYEKSDEFMHMKELYQKRRALYAQWNTPKEKPCGTTSL